MAVKIKAKPPAVKASVDIEKTVSGELVATTATEENVPMPKTVSDAEQDGPPFCEVGMSLSYTRNLGNYESLRVSVSLTMPASVPEVEEVYEYVKTWTESKLEQINEENTEALEGDEETGDEV